MKRNKYQRQAYAEQRANMAIERFLTVQSSAEKLQAKRWAVMWGLVSGVKKWVNRTVAHKYQGY
jgi:hypothetical protein